MAQRLISHAAAHDAPVCLCLLISPPRPLFLQRPLGMRQLITKTLDAILLNTRHPILPSMSVVLAVRNFLEVCYSREDHKRRGYRSAFLSLLHTIAKKIKDDPSLAGIFFDSFPAKENRVSSHSTRHSERPALARCSRGGDCVGPRTLTPPTNHSFSLVHVRRCAPSMCRSPNFFCSPLSAR